jgi:AcrR family transcriptional regulator
MRKQPRQARSRATIEAILDAAARILAQRGWEGFTTNAAAEVAGVSIGSLYQYFPNKLALIEAVRHRHFDQVLAALRAAADRTLSPTQRVSALVDGMIAVHARQPAAHRVLLEEAPRASESRAAHDRFAVIVHQHYEAIVKANRPVRSTRDTRIAAQVLAAAVAGIVHDAASRGGLHSLSFRREFQLLVEAYLLL